MRQTVNGGISSVAYLLSVRSRGHRASCPSGGNSYYTVYIDSRCVSGLGTWRRSIKPRPGSAADHRSGR